MTVGDRIKGDRMKLFRIATYLYVWNLKITTSTFI